MKLYEYEAKNLLKKAGIRVPTGDVATSPQDAQKVATRVGMPIVLKAQVLRGARGKAGGIKFASTPEEASERARELFELTVFEEPVKKLLIEEKLDIARELYLSVTVDSAKGRPIIMASNQGGMEVEEITEREPQSLITESIEVFRGLGGYQARFLAHKLDLPIEETKRLSKLISLLYNVFWQYDAQLVEINPLIVTQEGEIFAADAKISIDDNALGRQSKLSIEQTKERFTCEEEYEASQYGLNYVKLGGDIGVLCTGAGLTMTTLDLIKQAGGAPANFLEFGGATYDNSYHALRIVLMNPKLKVVLINTFGLVARADVISEGLVKAIDDLKPKVPLVASIRGTQEERAKEILKGASGMEVLPNVEAAVDRAVNIAGEV